MTLSRRSFLGKAALASAAALVPLPVSLPRVEAQAGLPAPLSRTIHVHGRMVVRDKTFRYPTDEPIFIVESGGHIDISGCTFLCTGGGRKEQRPLSTT